MLLICAHYILLCITLIFCTLQLQTPQFPLEMLSRPHISHFMSIVMYSECLMLLPTRSQSTLTSKATLVWRVKCTFIILCGNIHVVRLFCILESFCAVIHNTHINVCLFLYSRIILCSNTHIVFLYSRTRFRVFIAQPHLSHFKLGMCAITLHARHYTVKPNYGIQNGWCKEQCRIVRGLASALNRES